MSPRLIHRPRVSLRAIWGILLTLTLGLAGCDCGGGGATRCSSDGECEIVERCLDARCVPRTTGSDGGSTCVDRDGDGRGLGCAAGPDCNDDDSRVGGPERCDGLDNDCNGRIDEGYADICVECSPSCEISSEPGTAGWLLDPASSEGVILDDTGAITLGRSAMESFAIWVANMDEGTVSKLDSRTNVEVARYPTVGASAPAGSRPWAEACNWVNLGNCPSRTAVDQEFNAYVANRAFGNQSTITKYANDEADCVDRSGDGIIQTSRDLNGDGMIGLDPALGEFIGPDDECILWTSPVGAANGVARALAVGLAPPDEVIGDIWVGLFNGREACRLNPRTGAVLACMPINNFQPYGFAADASNRIWVADRSSSRRDLLGYIDATTMTFATVAPMPGTQCAIPYGITVDALGQVYLANDCSLDGAFNGSIFRYEPSSGIWTGVDIPGAGFPRGVAADEQFLWVGLSHATSRGSPFANRIVQYRLEDLSVVATHTMPLGSGPVGVGVSFDGSIWAIYQDNDMASRFDPATGSWIEHPVGLNPYTYSDFVGFGLNVFAEPRGHHRFIVEGCADAESQWQGVRYDATVPDRTRVEVWARSADTVADLETETFLGPFEGNPANLQAVPGPVPPRRYLQVELRLVTMDRSTSPRILDVDVALVCVGSLG